MSIERAETEPSTQDLLASIRRIISEDVGGEEKVLNQKHDDILDLTEVVTQDGSVISLSPQENKNDGLNSNQEDTAPSLLSQQATLQTMAALEDIDKLNEKIKKSIHEGSFGQQTLEEFVHAILKPMLKAWLDAHLPSLVKWVVTEQIEKILRQKQEESAS